MAVGWGGGGGRTTFSCFSYVFETPTTLWELLFECFGHPNGRRTIVHSRPDYKKKKNSALSAPVPSQDLKLANGRFENCGRSGVRGGGGAQVLHQGAPPLGLPACQAARQAGLGHPTSGSAPLSHRHRGLCQTARQAHVLGLQAVFGMK